MTHQARRGGTGDGDRIRFVTRVSEPPELTAELLQQIADESRREHAAFMQQTASMEIIPLADLKIRVR